MKTWVTLLLLLLVACAAAFGWHALALDPGYVLIQFGERSIETTFVFALVALLLLWGAASVLWRIARWPLAAWQRRSRRRARERLGQGLVALAEGRYAHALRELERAAQQTRLQAPALLAAARAAHARGEALRADALLTRAASAGAEAAALALRARFALEQGRPEAALALLRPPRAAQGVASARDKADKPVLVPTAWRLLAEAALAVGDSDTALITLEPLSATLTPAQFAPLQARVLTAALTAVPDAARLHARWTDMTRAQRRVPDALAAYARRAAQLGQTLAAMSELEDALRREWSEALVRVYGELGNGEADTRLRHAEAWLDAHPNSPALLLTLGRLCIQCELPGKARDYLQRGLALEPSPALWEARGDAAVALDDARAAECAYRNALRSARGEAVDVLPEAAVSALDTRASVVEERTAHGVPRLPQT